MPLRELKIEERRRLKMPNFSEQQYYATVK